MTEIAPRLAEAEADVQGPVEADVEALLGVPFPWDAEDGLTLGDKIAHHVFTAKLRAL
ncbi:hypothetical protein [Streptomyces litmocidini]|uniref:hypothetical protein n=1 Tax=Streptomyces litmocidini TaxID=67318 RepID=UPI00167CB12A|nr:hypothetical protein [Streptomyces litmocidini]